MFISSRSREASNSFVVNLSTMARVKSWTIEDVSGWLVQSGFEKLVDDFRDQGVDGEVLLTLTCLGQQSSPWTAVLNRILKPLTLNPKP